MWLNQTMQLAPLPYNPISDYYKKIFGHKVFKVPVSIADDCPNRAGFKGMETCVFCDEYGSFAYPENQRENLKNQIQMHQAKVAKRFNSKKFLVYFQAYTTTFNQYKKIEQAFEVALANPDTVGIIIGTRPDCLSDSLLDLWHHVSQQVFVGVELGVQSFDNKQLEWMRRGHSAEQSMHAIQKISTRCPQVDLGIHLMFGWPDESLYDVVRAARICNSLPIDNVKLHNLHVLRNTPLEKIYEEGKFTPIEFEPYADMVGAFLMHLSPETYIHRLIAIASNWEELVAPKWARYKMGNYQRMIDHMHMHGWVQGQKYSSSEGVVSARH
ncbi:MAG: TIGR01212 family radical SAM protein [Bdellovibrionaceae bacterium]|nr:TIGR01212 family radical SAM protein [Pseudobdellovibrionaceae bacterium]